MFLTPEVAHRGRDARDIIHSSKALHKGPFFIAGFATRQKHRPYRRRLPASPFRAFPSLSLNTSAIRWTPPVRNARTHARAQAISATHASQQAGHRIRAAKLPSSLFFFSFTLAQALPCSLLFYVVVSAMRELRRRDIAAGTGGFRV